MGKVCKFVIWIILLLLLQFTWSLSLSEPRQVAYDTSTANLDCLPNTEFDQVLSFLLTEVIINIRCTVEPQLSNASFRSLRFTDKSFNPKLPRLKNHNSVAKQDTTWLKPALYIISSTVVIYHFHYPKVCSKYSRTTWLQYQDLEQWQEQYFTVFKLRRGPEQTLQQHQQHQQHHRAAVVFFLFPQRNTLKKHLTLWARARTSGILYIPEFYWNGFSRWFTAVITQRQVGLDQKILSGFLKSELLWTLTFDL